jgi:hypothetical protein
MGNLAIAADLVAIERVSVQKPCRRTSWWEQDFADLKALGV